jgi:hypothetical protein
VSMSRFTLADLMLVRTAEKRVVNTAGKLKPVPISPATDYRLLFDQYRLMSDDNQSLKEGTNNKDNIANELHLGIILIWTFMTDRLSDGQSRTYGTWMQTSIRQDFEYLIDGYSQPVSGEE